MLEPELTETDFKIRRGAFGLRFLRRFQVSGLVHFAWLRDTFDSSGF